jgi:hypothetical protein
MQPYIESKHAIPVQGDALIAADVQRAWEVAGNVDFLLFTLGGVVATFHPIKGVMLVPPNIVTQAFLTALCTAPAHLRATLRVVAISAMGLTSEGHAHLPLPMRLLYSWMLPGPHRDKAGLECVLAHCAGRTYEGMQPEEDIMGAAWQNREGLPAAGTVPRILVVRPAWLTDGKCKAEASGGAGRSGTSKVQSMGKGNAYRVSEDDMTGWVISRSDVAHFLFDAIVNKWDEFEGKCVNLVY